MPNYALYDLLSQAHCSVTYFLVFWAILFWFGGWFTAPIALLLALGLGVAERKFYNKRWVLAVACLLAFC